MEKVHIIGNGHWRDLENKVTGGDYYLGFTYKGEWYCLDDFVWIPDGSPEWLRKFDGYLTDSFFSGIVIKYDPDEDRVQVYTFIS